jgi:hypothetical protein
MARYQETNIFCRLCLIIIKVAIQQEETITYASIGIFSSQLNEKNRMMIVSCIEQDFMSQRDFYR